MPNDYTRISRHLPAVYAHETESFAQLDTYLELVDAEARRAVGLIDLAPGAHGPDAALAWPAQIPLDAGPEAVLDAMLSVYDDLAGWFAYEYPRTWTRDEPGVLKRREFTRQAARIWRRRNTPNGLISWFMLAFDIAPGDRPYLIEHFMFPEFPASDHELTGTLFVRSTVAFDDYRRRREAIGFIADHAPAHVLLRVCWMPPELVFPDPTEYDGDLARYRSDVSTLLCSMVSHVGEGLGFTLTSCPPTPEPGRHEASDRLDLGYLPSERTEP